MELTEERVREIVREEIKAEKERHKPLTFEEMIKLYKDMSDREKKWPENLGQKAT